MTRFWITLQQGIGRYVEEGFEYSSGTNPHFLSIDEIWAFNHLS